jgi:hypothetical protein
MSKDNPTFSIDIQPLGDGRLQVSIPEIEASTIVESTRRDDAMDAAYRLISAYLRKQQEEVKAS